MLTDTKYIEERRTEKAQEGARWTLERGIWTKETSNSITGSHHFTNLIDAWGQENHHDASDATTTVRGRQTTKKSANADDPKPGPRYTRRQMPPRRW